MDRFLLFMALAPKSLCIWPQLANATAPLLIVLSFYLHILFYDSSGIVRLRSKLLIFHYERGRCLGYFHRLDITASCYGGHRGRLGEHHGLRRWWAIWARTWEIFVDLWALWGYLRNNRGGMHYWHLLRRPFRAEAGVQGHIKRGVFLQAAMGADLGWTGVLMITIVQ